MSDLSKVIGQRIRNYRTEKKLSQENLAELCGCHPTYIGQVERGEKNATLESIEKIASALNISLSTLFEKLGAEDFADQSGYFFMITNPQLTQTKFPVKVFHTK